MSKAQLFNKLLSHHELKMTELRKDILDIFLSIKKPLTAYELLNKLKKKRPNAEPPTVYRVIDYFLKRKLIHRIETGNKFVLCTQPNHLQEHDDKSVLFLCKNCSLSFEISDPNFASAVKNFSHHHGLQIDESLIEIKGMCKKCLATAHK